MSFSLTDGSSLLYEGLFTDFTIIAGADKVELRVHKSIMFGESGYFKRLLTGDNRVGVPLR